MAAHNSSDLACWRRHMSEVWCKLALASVADFSRTLRSPSAGRPVALWPSPAGIV
jgi:hypothetical protein